MSGVLFCSECGGLAVDCGRLGLLHRDPFSKCGGGYAAVAVWSEDVLELQTIEEMVRV